jgi:hypothetical protein
VRSRSTLPTTVKRSSINGAWNQQLLTRQMEPAYAFIPQSNTCIDYTTYTLNITIKIMYAWHFDFLLTCSGTKCTALNTASLT